MSVDRRNNIGLVRLILAALVIASHSPEMVDGDRSRELATMLWGTLSLGELAVDGFFVVSGYLITQSFERSASPVSYLRKRIARIYPAFLVAFAICFFVVAPLAGRPPSDPIRNAVNALLLTPPSVEGVFEGLPYPLLNGAMWSIAYEFRCYLLVLLLGVIGALKWRAAIALCAAAFLLLVGFHQVPPWVVPYDTFGIFGFLPLDIRMSGAFMIGMSFYLYRDAIPMRGAFAAMSAGLLAGMMFVPAIAELAACILGGYVLLWFGFHARSLPIAQSTDVSYGLYLYAWPVGSLTLWYMGPATSPWLLAAITTIGAALLGTASWFAIEKPALKLVQRERRGIAQPAS